MMFESRAKFGSIVVRLCARGIPLLAWCMLIFLLSSVPGNRYPQVSWPFADKLVHLFLYCVLGFLACGFIWSRRFHISMAWPFGVFYGLTDEIHQLWVPRRTFSMEDLLADACGVTLGIFVFYIMIHNNVSYNADMSDSPTEQPERMEIT